MALPVTPVTYPSSLKDQTNGKVDADLLRSVSTPGGTATLVTPAHRSWLALESAARRNGHILVPFSTYRSYASQEKLFTVRYTTRQISTTDRKMWNRTRYYKLPGVPVTAAPGTSNHGWGLAVDVQALRNGHPTSIDHITDTTFRWLLENADRYGFSFEIQSERWHIRYYAGDDIPAATVAYAATQPPQQGDDLTPAESTMLKECHAALVGKDSAMYEVLADARLNGPTHGRILAAIAEDTDQLADSIVMRLNSISSPAGRLTKDDVADAVRSVFAELGDG